MSIDISNYKAWKNDEVTKALFISLKEIRKAVHSAMLNPDLIMLPHSDKELARLVGKADVLDLILEMTFEDFKEDGVDVDDQEDNETSGL